MTERPCDFRPERHWEDPPCPALAVTGERFCAAHLALFRDGPIKAVRPRPTMPDSDVLPWTPEDKRRFDELKPLEVAKTRKAGIR